MKIAYLLCLLVAGCSAQHSVEEGAIEMWRSRQATTQQRVNAVKELIPVGTTGAEAQRILGHKGAWIHHHGFVVDYPQANTNPAQPAAQYSQWTLEYEVSGGSIALQFEQPNDVLDHDRFRFVAVSFQPVKSVFPVQSNLPTGFGQ
jgi:hypothetical protein